MAALDQMDYLMHQPDTAGSTPGSGFHGLPQHQGCPYFRNQQQHHGSSLPPPHFDPGFHPMAHQLPHLSQLSHTGHPSSSGSGAQNRGFHSTVGGNHGQQQQQQQHQQHQQQTHPQTQPQSQPPSQPQQQLPPIQPPTLPYPQPYSHSHPSHPSHPPHPPHHSSHYDPVHAANAAWFQNQNQNQGNQGNQWLAHTFHSHSYSHSHSHSNSNSHHANQHHAHHSQHPHHTPTTQFPHSRPPAADSHFGSPGSGPNVVQPLHQFPSHYEPYPPLNYPGFQRGTYQRSSISLPTPPQLSNDQANRQDHADENQPSQHNQVPNSHSPPVAMSADRGAPPPDRRGFTLPALNPNSNQPSSSSQQNSQPASSSREPSPPGAATPADLQAVTRHHSGPTSTNRETPDAQAAATPTPQLPLPSDYPTMDYNGYMRNTHSSLTPSRGQPAIPPNPSSAAITARRRQAISRRLRPTDHDSDEEVGGSSADEEEQVLRYIDEFGANPGHFRSLMAEDHIRATQLLRGQLSNKRVASRKALSSLQSVSLDSLSPTERTCVICYNDFGQTSPEGVIEAPLRLPKCQHVFGDHCIKKWFEEADSCPYCRDKVPSELASAPGARAFHNMIRMRHQANQGNLPPST
jgi:hypothetical protein